MRQRAKVERACDRVLENAIAGLYRGIYWLKKTDCQPIELRRVHEPQSNTAFFPGGME